jgi:predicted ArsR family transcriptional regulator
MRQANPTRKTQEKILKVLKDTPETQTITSLAEKTSLNTNQVRASIEFLEKLGILRTIVSSKGTTLIQLNEVKNATARAEEIPLLQSKMEFFAYESGRASAIKEFKKYIRKQGIEMKDSWVISKRLFEEFEKELGGTK